MSADTTTIPAPAVAHRPAGQLLTLVMLAGAGVVLVAAGTGLAALMGPVVAVPGVLIARHDLVQRRIPRGLVYATLAGSVVVAVLCELVDDRSVGLSVVLGAAMTGGPFLVVHLVSPGGVGFGDVRYATVLGAALGVEHVSLGPLMAVGATASATFAAAMYRPWRRSIPMGLFLVLSSLVVLSLSGLLRASG